MPACGSWHLDRQCITCRCLQRLRDCAPQMKKMLDLLGLIKRGWGVWFVFDNESLWEIAICLASTLLTVSVKSDPNSLKPQRTALNSHRSDLVMTGLASVGTNTGRWLYVFVGGSDQTRRRWRPALPGWQARRVETGSLLSPQWIQRNDREIQGETQTSKANFRSFIFISRYSILFMTKNPTLKNICYFRYMTKGPYSYSKSHQSTGHILGGSWFSPGKITNFNP